MERFWNKDIRRMTIRLLLIMIAGGAFFNLAFFAYLQKSRHAEYETLTSLAQAVMETYPEMPQEEIIKAIANGSANEKGRGLLKQYGIIESMPAAYEKGQESQRVLWTINGIMCMTFLAIFVVLWLSWKKRNEKLTKLCHYVDRVSLGDYGLDIQNNQEDELSGLKNELYKLVVSHREQAQLAKSGKETLAKSLEDISHQLKTPLTSAVVLADNLLENEDMAPEVRKRFVQEINRQLIGMKWLVVTLLKLSRLDAGVVELQRTAVSLKNVMDEVLQNLEMNAEWKQIQFQTKLVEAKVTGDEKWLVEAFQNIVKNALEYSPQGESVEITMEDNDVYAQVRIRDHGPGIPQEDQKHIFERFYRTSKVENENVGIGLALAKEIIEKHNGYVTVDSDDTGTTFTVRFLKTF